jgi:hypothetical protein
MGHIDRVMTLSVSIEDPDTWKTDTAANSVKRAIIRKGYDIEELERVLIPVIMKKHWILLELRPLENKMVVYEGLRE